jgi:hypothetical protein
MSFLFMVPSSASAPPEWAGWAGLIVLLVTFGLLAWWLLASPLPHPLKQGAPTERVLRVRRLMAALVLLSGVLVRIGAPWDELWHRLYGLPFGQDLLWAPHLFLYASFALTFFLVAYGLSVVLRGQGSLRARFRREPLLGLLGLFAAYRVTFIPVDVLWHEIIGPDLIAESPPHIFGALLELALPLTGMALALSTIPRRQWRSLLDRLRTMEVLALALLAELSLSWLQLFTTSWEWPGDVPLGRPAWIYPVMVLLIGVAFAHLAVYSTRRIGAATAVALTSLAVHALTVSVFRAYLVPGPVIAAHALLLPPAVVLDAWYGLRARHEELSRRRSAATLWAGALLYGAAFFAVGLPYIARVVALPTLDPSIALVSAALGLPAALAASLASARIGTWVAHAGHEPSSV